MFNIQTKAQQKFIDGFITALLWSELLDDGTPADQSGLSLDKASVQLIEKQCLVFIEQNADMLAEYATYIVPNEYDVWERAGHDFVLTRNRHGAGFWDRDYKDNEWCKDVSYIGDKLTEASHEWGEMLIYVADDETLSVSVGV